MTTIKRFGPQPPAINPTATYYDCGICGHLHPITWDGDCRDDANRFSFDQLDAKHGQHGYTIVDMPD